MAIRQAVNLHRQQRFAFNWLNLVTVFHSSLSLLYTTASVSGGSGSGEREGLGLVLDLDLGKAMGDLGLAVELLEAFCRKFSSAEKILGMVKAAMERLRVYTTTSTMSMG